MSPSIHWQISLLRIGVTGFKAHLSCVSSWNWKHKACNQQGWLLNLFITTPPPPPSIKSVKNFRRVPGTDSDCTERSLRDPLKHCSPEKMCLRKSLFVFYRVFISRSTLFPMSSGRSSLIKIIPLPAECHEYLLVCLEIIEHRNLCQHFVFEMCRMVVWCLEVIW